MYTILAGSGGMGRRRSVAFLATPNLEVPVSRRVHFRSALAGGIIAALVVTALPTIAAQVGDALKLGQINVIQQRTTLQGQPATSNLRVRNNGTGTALDLHVTSGPPLRVNSNAKVPMLHADLLDGRNATQLIRSAHAISVEIDEGVFVGGAADILSTTISAPKPGTLIMGASVDASGSADDQYTCQLRVDGFVVAGTSRVSRVNWAGVSHTDNSQENCSTDGAQVVPAGAHTVDFRVFGRNTAAFHSATVWVIWVPFGGNGAVPSP